jgi:hypothetical protein
LPDDRRIRIQAAQNHADPMDPDPDAACAFDVPFKCTSSVRKTVFKIYMAEFAKNPVWKNPIYSSFFLFILQQMPGKIFTYLTITSKRVIF